MRIRFWILISVFLHFFVLLLYSVSRELYQRTLTNIMYVQMEDFSVSRPSKAVKTKRIDRGDLESVKEKVQTNSMEEEQTAADSGPTNYVPFYLVEQLPQALTPIRPQYPEEARVLGIEGRVVLEIAIDEEGVVRKVKVLKTPHVLLGESARRAVFRTRFSPAKIKGRACAVRVQFSIRFRLE